LFVVPGAWRTGDGKQKEDGKAGTSEPGTSVTGQEKAEIKKAES
jgi:hypothetical protein